MAGTAKTLNYRNPPVIHHPGIFSAEKLVEKVDWGQHNLNIPAIQRLSLGEGIKVGICDTGKPTHADIGELAFAHNCSESTSVDDKDGHGTHVSGILRAQINGFGIVGVAPKVTFGMCKVLDDDGFGSNKGVVEGIRACIDEKCDIISMSLGGERDKGMLKACDDAIKAGIHIICAVGNDGDEGTDNVGWPAKHPGTIAITSYNKHGKISEFSSRGDEVDFAFPGEQILSTWLNNKYKVLSGSSMATPFGAGVVALLLSHLKTAKIKPYPKTPAGLRALLRTYCEDLGPQGHDRDWGFGIPKIAQLLRSPTVKALASDTGTGPYAIQYPVQHRGRTGIFITLKD